MRSIIPEVSASVPLLLSNAVDDDPSPVEEGG